jgi:hypothetical protein
LKEKGSFARRSLMKRARKELQPGGLACDEPVLLLPWFFLYPIHFVKNPELDKTYGNSAAN